jgi:hypothetical protein
VTPRDFPWIRSALIVRFITVVSALLLPSVALAADPTRVVVVLNSSDGLIKDLKHMVVDLAKEPKRWDADVFPNIDIFLIGVDKSRPVRFDQLIDGESGARPQYAIPVSDLKEFIADNLDPIGIVAKKFRRQNEYYELTGDVYKGWMRIVDNYAAFADSEHEADVPANMPSPVVSHKELLAKGYDTAAQLDNSRTTPEQRKAAFAKFRDNLVAGLKKRPQETNEQFALRETSSTQQMEVLERLFVESADVVIGWTTDTAKSEALADLRLVPAEGTELDKTVRSLGATPSYFAGIKSAENAVMSGRVNFALDDLITGHLRKSFEQARPVALQDVDNDTKKQRTPEQKAARKQISELLLDMATAALDLHVVDGAVEVTPGATGKHTAVMGVRTADGSVATQIVELLPKANDSFKSELSIDQEGDVAIHRVTIVRNYYKAFADFLGEPGEIYVGTSKDSVWLAAGEGALDALKSGVKTGAETQGAAADPVFARMDMHLRPLLVVTNQLRKDGDFDLMKSLESRGALEEVKTEGEKTTSDAQQNLQMLKDFEWRDAAIEALSGQDDRVTFHLKQAEGRVDGAANVKTGVLKAVGKLIAKFAAENLSG